MWPQLLRAVRVSVVLGIATGLVYPLVVTGLARAVFPSQAKGSLISRGGQVIGSELIGQTFKRPEYFHSRPSAAGSGYDASASSGSNLGPTSRKLIDRTRAGIEEFRKNNAEFSGPLPADLVTASSSGLDPHISPASAQAQAARVAKARSIPVESVRDLVAEITETRTLGVLGEPRVNVLRLNLALDGRYPAQPVPTGAP